MYISSLYLPTCLSIYLPSQPTNCLTKRPNNQPATDQLTTHQQQQSSQQQASTTTDRLSQPASQPAAATVFNLWCDATWFDLFTTKRSLAYLVC